ncbi:MAG: glycoside hydrolase family 97 catalytic domain-containing protein, partial [Planctomycetota bacterium]
LEQKTTQRLVRVEFRVFDQAIAFRYVIPAKRRFVEEFVITGELTEFRLEPKATAYVEYGHEGSYHERSVDQVRKGCELPLLVRDKVNGLFHVIQQADAVDYPRRFVRTTKSGGVLGYTLKDKVNVRPAYSVPWSVISTADTAGKLIEQNYIRDALVDDRSPEPEWIVPGKVMRVLKLTTKGSKEVIDFAADNGLEYVEFDAGWYGDQDDPNADACTAIPGLDMAAVCEYGRSKNVGVILYVNRVHLRSQLSCMMQTYHGWGIRGLKFGFVDGRTARGIEDTHNWVETCGRYEMVVDIHDTYRPTGVSQRLPNLLTQEGIRGNEWMPTTRHTTTMPFTRFVAGAGDYTICYRVGGRSKATNCHQLALSVIVFSPLQFVFWYGSPSGHRDSLGREWFKILPTVWDDTKVICGEIGEYYAVARRKGADWFIGGITSDSARTLEMPLGFLEAGVKYRATYYRDAEGKELVVGSREVTSTQTLTENLTANGGVAIVLQRVK